jgi:MFS family permease
MRSLGRKYWLIWTASVHSNLADGIFRVAIPLLAVQYTDSPALVAGVAFVYSLPWLVFALYAGALVDRWDRRLTMRRTSALRVGVFALISIALVAGFDSLPLLYAAALALGFAETLYDTSAQTIVPQLVEAESLSGANSRLYIAEVAANGFLGPSLGGLLVGVSVVIAFGTSGLAYFGALLALCFVSGRFVSEQPTKNRSLHSDIREGLAYLLRNRTLCTLAVVGGITNMMWFAWQSVLVLYAVNPGPMGMTEFGFGVLLACGSAGSIAGAFVTEHVQALIGRAWMLKASVIGWGVWLLGPALSDSVWVVGGLIILGSATAMWWNVITVTWRQSVVPEHMLGRANSVYRMLAWGGMPLGAAFAGLFSEFLGLRVFFSITGIVVLLMLVPLTFIVTEKSLRVTTRSGGT